VNAEFKLYRNLDALYEVFGTLTEVTRVFGQKGDYEALAQQLQVIGSTRRKLGESLEQLTATAQNQLNQMRAQIKAQQEQLAAAAAAPPKQIVVAQAEPPKKAAPKKKSVAKKPASAGSGSNSNSPSSNSNGQTSAVTNAPKS
jgi:peptidoglycan hydrolase CwlO-like protein